MIANATFTPPHSPLGSSPSLMLLTQLHLAAESLLRRLFLLYSMCPKLTGVQILVTTSLVVEVQMVFERSAGCIVQWLPATSKLGHMCPVWRRERRWGCIVVVFKSCPSHLSICEF